MAVAVASNLTTISSCESTSGWTDLDSRGLTATDEVVRQGTNCLGFDLDDETARFYYALAQTDYSDTHVYVWVLSMTPAWLATRANGGIFVIGRDNTGNMSYWYVGGSDTYSGGWKCFVVHTGRTPDGNSGANAVMARCTGIGIGFRGLARSKLARNTYFDFVRVGNGGIKVTGGSAASPGTWAEVCAGDQAAAVGVVRNEGGVFHVQGPIEFGDEAAGDLWFHDASQIVVFEGASVASSLYELKVVGNAAGTTSLKLGNVSGGRGVQGCVFKAAGGATYKITATDGDIDALGLYGCSFLNAGTIVLPPAAEGRDVLSCSFEGCAEVLPDTCKFEYGTVVSAQARGLRLSSPAHNVRNTSFVNCQACVHVAAPGTYGVEGLVFAGSDGMSKFDIENSSAGAVVVNATSGSNPVYARNTGGGTTTINNVVPLVVRVEDALGVLVPDASVRIERVSDGAALLQAKTDAQGRVSSRHNYTGDTAIEVSVRRSSEGSPRYVPVRTTGTITRTGFALNVVMQPDLVAPFLTTTTTE